MNNGGSNKDRTKGKKMYRTSPPRQSFASPRRVRLRADLVS